MDLKNLQTNNKDKPVDTLDESKLAKPNQSAAGQEKQENVAEQIKRPAEAPADSPTDPLAVDQAALNEERNNPDGAAANVAAEAVAEAMPATENLGTRDGNRQDGGTPADEDSNLMKHDPNAKPEVKHQPEVDVQTVETIRPDEPNLAGALADESQPTDSDGFVTYSSHPLARLRIGRRWQFVDGLLKLPADEANEFDKAMQGADVRTRSQVRKIDVRAAERLIANRKPIATKAIDSVDALAGARTEVGKEELRSADETVGKGVETPQSVRAKELANK